jgi:hypothetical protein
VNTFSLNGHGADPDEHVQPLFNEGANTENGVGMPNTHDEEGVFNAFSIFGGSEGQADDDPGVEI